MKSFLVKTLAVAAIVFSGALIAAAPASAAPASHVAAAVPHIAAASSHDGGTQGDGVIKGYINDYLAMNRWRDATGGLHSRYDQFLQNDVISATMRNVAETQYIDAGNGLYSVSGGLIGFADNMQPLNLAGNSLDKAFASLSGSLFNPVGGSILAIIVIGVVANALFQMRRHGAKPLRKILTLGALLAMLMVMTAGASASTVGASGEFQPGFLSPGWIATKVNNTIRDVALLPSGGLLALDGNGSTSFDAPKPSADGCYIYQKSLHDSYIQKVGSGGSVDTILSGLWENTGLSVWKQAQYGSAQMLVTGNETYGDSVYCHQLDWQNSTPAAEQALRTFGGDAAALKKFGYNADSAAWGHLDNNNREDASLVAWAACVVDPSAQPGTFTIRGHWADPKADGSNNDKAITPQDCHDWWTKSKADWGDGDHFNISGSVSDVLDAQADPAVRDFLFTLHGNIVGPGLILVWTYVISAVCVAIVFIGMSIGIILAKFASVTMILAILFLLIMGMVRPEAASEKLMGFVKGFIGYTVITFGTTLILSVIALLTRVFSSAATAAFGSGNIIALIAAGLSPLLAVVVIHMLITKVLKMPTPFKPSGALAWGASGRGVGGTVASRAVERMERSGGQAIRKGGKNAINAAGSYLKGGLNGKGGVPAMTMKPGGADGPGAGGAGGPGTGAGTIPKSAAAIRMDRTAALAEKMTTLSDADLKTVQFTRQQKRDLRWMERGVDPSTIPETRMGRIGHASSYALRRAAAGSTEKFKEIENAIASEDGRTRAAMYAKATRERVQAGMKRLGDAAVAYDNDPSAAWKGLAQNVGTRVSNTIQDLPADRIAKATGAGAAAFIGGHVVAGPAGGSVAAAVVARRVYQNSQPPAVRRSEAQRFLEAYTDPTLVGRADRRLPNQNTPSPMVAAPIAAPQPAIATPAPNGNGQRPSPAAAANTNGRAAARAAAVNAQQRPSGPAAS